jgi:hypothetical protein
VADDTLRETPFALRSCWTLSRESLGCSRRGEGLAGAPDLGAGEMLMRTWTTAWGTRSLSQSWKSATERAERKSDGSALDAAGAGAPFA